MGDFFDVETPYGRHMDYTESIQAFLVCLHFFQWTHTHWSSASPSGLRQVSFSCLLRETWGGRLSSISLPFCLRGIQIWVSMSETWELPVTRFLSSSPLAPLEAALSFLATYLYLYQVITYQWLPAQSLPRWSLSIFLAQVESRSTKITASASHIFRLHFVCCFVWHSNSLSIYISANRKQWRSCGGIALWIFKI